MANTRSKNRVALRWRILGLASGQFPANVENGHDVLEWPQGERQALLWDRSRREVTHFVLIGVGVELREGPHLATMALTCLGSSDQSKLENSRSDLVNGCRV